MNRRWEREISARIRAGQLSADAVARFRKDRALEHKIWVEKQHQKKRCLRCKQPRQKGFKFCEFHRTYLARHARWRYWERKIEAEKNS